jgi:Uma2 family endonuclease
MRTDVKFTYADYAVLPENGRIHQVIEGDLLMSPSPSYFHQSLVMRIAAALFQFAEGRKLGSVRTGPLDVILDDENVLVPDVVYVSNGRSSIIVPEGLRGAPDLVVEVLSPSNARLDRQVKRRLYARFGVTELWLVDPDAQRVEVYRLQENLERPARMLETTDTLTTNLLPGLEIALSMVFAPDQVR